MFLWGKGDALFKYLKLPLYFQGCMYEIGIALNAYKLSYKLYWTIEKVLSQVGLKW